MVGRSYIVGGSIYLTLTTGLCTGLGVSDAARCIIGLSGSSLHIWDDTSPGQPIPLRSGTTTYYYFLSCITITYSSCLTYRGSYGAPPAVDPVPQRLVQRIRAGQFVEMRELLGDNIALHDQLEAVQVHMNLSALPSMCRMRQREVPSLVS